MGDGRDRRDRNDRDRDRVKERRRSRSRDRPSTHKKHKRSRSRDRDQRGRFKVYLLIFMEHLKKKHEKTEMGDDENRSFFFCTIVPTDQNTAKNYDENRYSKSY